MKMKFSIVVLLLLETCYCTSVSLSSKCTCTTIQIQPDCIQLDGCEWDSSTSKCVKNPTVSYYSQLCSSLTDKTKCVKQFGCAYVTTSCVVFADCISYTATSNAECQAYSLRCNYSPSKGVCTEEDVCSEYSGDDKQTGCAAVVQKNGDGLCLYDTTGKVCRKKICEDYSKTTDDDCKNVIQNQTCITDKKTCVIGLKTCDKYAFDECLSIKATTSCQVSNDTVCVSTQQSCTIFTSNCATMIGNKGQCYVLDSTHCRDPLCTDYVFTTDKECLDANPVLKCITNGFKCVGTLETNCSTVDTTSCPNAKSQLGLCKLNGAVCTDVKCTDNSGTQDSECSKYSSNCVSNGVACVEGLAATCSLITPSQGTTCQQYHTKEGKCKSPSSGANCELDACIDQKSVTTDAQCNLYKSSTSTCITDGVDCVTSLTNCKDINIGTNSCSQYIGSDGKCIDDTINTGKCTVTACGAITSPANEQDCKTGNTGCIFDGIGCIEPSAKKTCDKYTANCDKVINTSDGKLCVSDSTATKCVVKTCDTAPSTNNTDDLCNTYLSGCKTNGNGCTSSVKDCKSHQGTQATCEKYIGTDGHCTGDATNTDTTACSPKICSNSKTANESACQAYSNKCLYSVLLKQCLPYVNRCSLISDQANCEQNLTIEDGRLCLWQNKQCITASCNLVNKGGSAEVCAIFGSNCQYDSISGCQDKTLYFCSTLRSRQTCTVDSSGKSCVWDVNNKLCFQFDQCEDYALSAVIPKSAQEIADETKSCKSISDKCYSNGTASCVSIKPCSYITDAYQCLQQTDYNDGKTKCGYDNVKKSCVKFGTCTDVKLTTHAECQQYSSTCTSDGTSCTALTACANITLEDGCNFGGTDGKCLWKDNKCSSWVCTDSQLTTYKDCQAQSTNCATDGTTCIDITSCDKYATEAGCNDNMGLKDKVLVPCFYDTTTSKCREEGCTDHLDQMDLTHCFGHTCGYDSDKKQCIDIVACSKYTTQGQCQIGLTNKVAVPCVYDSTKKLCQDKTCGDYTEITNQSYCVALNCGYDVDNKKCVTLGACSSYLTQNICNNNLGNKLTCLWTTTGDKSACVEITNCAGASTSQTVCQARGGCSFIPANTTANTTSQCRDSTCSTANYGHTKLKGCDPFLSADQKTITFCGWSDTNNTCVEEDSTVYNQESCFKWTKYTYYWDKTKQKCTACSSSSSSGNNSTSSNGSNSSTTEDNSAYILKQVILSSLLLQLV